MVVPDQILLFCVLVKALSNDLRAELTQKQYYPRDTGPLTGLTFE